MRSRPRARRRAHGRCRPVDAKNAPTRTWKTAQHAVSHSAHTHHRIYNGREDRRTKTTTLTRLTHEIPDTPGESLPTARQPRFSRCDSLPAPGEARTFDCAVRISRRRIPIAECESQFRTANHVLSIANRVSASANHVLSSVNRVSASARRVLSYPTVVFSYATARQAVVSGAHRPATSASRG